MTDEEGDNKKAHPHDDDELLEQWCAQLCDALEVEGLTVDLKAVLGLAGRAAHAVARPAAPLTTFVTGYAAGLAVGSGADSEEAIKTATATALQLSRQAAAADSAAHPGPASGR